MDKRFSELARDFRGGHQATDAKIVLCHAIYPFATPLQAP